MYCVLCILWCILWASGPEINVILYVVVCTKERWPGPGRMFFFNRSTLQRDDILTNQLAANTHVIARETQIFQCAAIN